MFDVSASGDVVKQAMVASVLLSYLHLLATKGLFKETGLTILLQYIMGHADCSITMNVFNHVSSLERIKKEVERIEKDSLAMSV